MRQFGLLFILVFVCFGCKKKEEIINHLDPETLKHFSFEVGTYWIYKDSVSGVEDSFYVKDNQTSVSAGTEYNNTYISSTQPNFTFSGCFFNLHLNVVSFKFIAQNDVGTDFKHPYTGGYSTITINGNVYDSVIVSLPASGSYYARQDVGMIKMSVVKDSIFKVYELQRYKIVK